MRTTNSGVDIGFLKGYLLEDRDAQLKGNGKKLRVLSLASCDLANADLSLPDLFVSQAKGLCRP